MTSLILFGAVLFLGGLFGFVAVRLGWYHSGALSDMDWLGVNEALGPRLLTAFYIVSSIAGGLLLLWARFRR